MNIFLKILLVFVMTFSGTIGAYFLKRTMTGIDGFNIKKLILSPTLYIGGFSYVLGAVINMILLRFIDYTVLYPMTALTYIWTLIFSYFVLKEKINVYKIAAVVFVAAGIIIIVI